MVVACKSDPDEDLAVQPLEGNEIGAPFNIGLVELSSYMPQGKHKMRMSFGWLLKAISKERRITRPVQAEVEHLDENQARTSSALHGGSGGNEQAHEWHHPTERRPLSDATADSDLVIRRTQSQGAVRVLQSGSMTSRVRQPALETKSENVGTGDARTDESKRDGSHLANSQLAPDQVNRGAKESETGDTAGSVRREKPPPISVITSGRAEAQKPPLVVPLRNRTERSQS